jgi:hypothetical protein
MLFLIVVDRASLYRFTPGRKRQTAFYCAGLGRLIVTGIEVPAQPHLSAFAERCA